MAEFTLMHHIILLRHGESQGNLEGRIQGQADYPLTERGQQQAAALARQWAAEGLAFDQIIASPLSRARQTAEAIAAVLDAPLEFEPLWKERTFGVVDGDRLVEIEARTPKVEFSHPYFPPSQDGETLLDVYARAGMALRSILRRPPGHTLVVTHGAIFNMALYVALSLSPQMRPHGPHFHLGNTAYARLAYNADKNYWNVYEIANPALKPEAIPMRSRGK